MSMHRTLFHTLSIIVILSMLFSGMVPSPASAQGPDGIERQVNPQTGKVSFLGPESGQVLAAADDLGKSTRPRDPAMALMKRHRIDDLPVVDADDKPIGLIDVQDLVVLKMFDVGPDA